MEIPNTTRVLLPDLIRNIDERGRAVAELGNLITELLDDESDILLHCYRWRRDSRHPAVQAIYKYYELSQGPVSQEDLDLWLARFWVHVLMMPKSMLEHLCLVESDKAPLDALVYAVWRRWSPYRLTDEMLPENLSRINLELTVFVFHTPQWINTVPPPTPLGALQRAETLHVLYPLLVQTGIHAVIEWCGVIGEHVRMLRYAFDTQQLEDVRQIDQHSEQKVKIPGYMIEYFCEKLGCQLKPFIHATPGVWRSEIEKWFVKSR